jgi:hypothetical protein
MIAIDGVSEAPVATITVVLGGTSRRVKMQFTQEATLGDLHQRIEKTFKIDRDQQRLSCDEVRCLRFPTETYTR